MTTNLEDSSVLVVVVRDPRDLAHALRDGWYRIPLARAPSRIGVEYLAFYQTGTFSAGEQWLVRRYAPVEDYRIVQRRELLPDEPDHPRATDRYYRIGLGPGLTLPCPIPSRRLRRITFIPTTLSRLLAAQEINDLWVKTDTQERMWQALRQAGLDAECQLEIAEGASSYTADFVLPCRRGHIVMNVVAPNQIALSLHEGRLFYQSAFAAPEERRHPEPHAQETDADIFIRQLLSLIEEQGGTV